MPNLDEYATSYSCTNAGGTTVVTPGTGASFAVTPVAGDDLTCTFTNSPLVADLQIVKTTTSTNVNVGDTVVYTLAVTNNGPGDAHGALIQDPAVTGLNCGAPAAAPTCGSEAGGAVCPVAPIAIGDLQGAGVVIPTLPVGGSVVLALSCVVE